jgi:hypothetical protein
MLDVGDLDFYFTGSRDLTENTGQPYVYQRQQDANPDDKPAIHNATPPLNS